MTGSPERVLLAAQDSDLTAKMKDGDMDGLAAQNAYMRDALEACRKQISELTQQVGTTPRLQGCSLQIRVKYILSLA